MDEAQTSFVCLARKTHQWWIGLKWTPTLVISPFKYFSRLPMTSATWGTVIGYFLVTWPCEKTYSYAVSKRMCVRGTGITRNSTDEKSIFFPIFHGWMGMKIKTEFVYCLLEKKSLKLSDIFLNKKYQSYVD